MVAGGRARLGACVAGVMALGLGMNDVRMHGYARHAVCLSAPVHAAFRGPCSSQAQPDAPAAGAHVCRESHPGARVCHPGAHTCGEGHLLLHLCHLRWP